jgi:hypothetical protein
MSFNVIHIIIRSDAMSKEHFAYQGARSIQLHECVSRVTGACTPAYLQVMLRYPTTACLVKAAAVNGQLEVETAPQLTEQDHEVLHAMMAA